MISQATNEETSAKVCGSSKTSNATERIIEIESRIAKTELLTDALLQPRIASSHADLQRYYHAVRMKCIVLLSIATSFSAVVAVVAPGYSMSISTYWLGHVFGLFLACRASLEVIHQNPT